MEFLNDTQFNVSDDVNITSTNLSVIVEPKEGGANSLLYLLFIPPMIAICIISVLINVQVVMSARWIRRPLSPTLCISLSLAAADAYMSAVVGLSLVQNSLLPQLVDMRGLRLECFELSLEALRLGGIIVSVVHLFALTVNHYLGILKPLHYASIVTHGKTTIVIALLWTMPTAFFLAYFALVPNDGFQSTSCTYLFLMRLRFRMTFAPIFFVPLGAMVVIYGHIYAIVKRHQATRLHFSRMSSRHRGQQRDKEKDEKMNSSIKAIHTTLLIIGTYVIGWMPAVIVYSLLCTDCVYHFEDFDRTVVFYVLMTVNSLFILKSVVNPIIYAARMPEIQLAKRQMYAAMCRGSHRTNEQMDDSNSSRLSQLSYSLRRTKRYCRSNILHHGKAPPGPVVRPKGDLAICESFTIEDHKVNSVY